tara:strand:+ start:4143 stop:5207 length:1065 start_codon:yes stop_codon:yes gene_type:complete
MASIIVTVGPKSIKPQILEKLLEAGANSFRINLSHSNKENLEEYFDILNKSGIIPAIDTQGAQLRVLDTNLKNKLNPGKVIKLIFGVENRTLIKKDDLFILLNHPEAFDQISKGDVMKVDFDGLALQIKSKSSTCLCIAEVLSSGSIVMNRAVDINTKSLNLSTLTDFDKYAIEYAISNGSKEIYASFISSASDVNYVRNFLGDKVSLISKIETSLGVSNVKEIMNVSDKILLDRGDLSREITIPSVPLAVFNILRLAKNKYDVLIATNVLDSMMISNLPSRAEISDIFNHLSAGASGIVLAAEVAIGNNPVSSTAFLKYLIEVFNNYENGLHGIGKIKKPSKHLVGEELFNWL